MSQEIPEEVSLEDLVRNSQLILVVERLEPFDKVEMVKLDKDEKKCPPFRKVSYRFKVVGELLNRNKSQLKPEIEVAAAQTSENMLLHRHMYLRGISKSTYVPEYKTRADFNSKKLIVFLSSRFEFVVHGAYESIENKSKVLKAIDGLKGLTYATAILDE